MKRPRPLRYLPLYDGPLPFSGCLISVAGHAGAADSELSRRLRERNDNSVINLQMKDLWHGASAS